jgi:hypothetical protein
MRRPAGEALPRFIKSRKKVVIGKIKRVTRLDNSRFGVVTQCNIKSSAELMTLPYVKFKERRG